MRCIDSVSGHLLGLSIPNHQRKMRCVRNSWTNEMYERMKCMNEGLCRSPPRVDRAPVVVLEASAVVLIIRVLMPAIACTLANTRRSSALELESTFERTGNVWSTDDRVRPVEGSIKVKASEDGTGCCDKFTPFPTSLHF